MAKGAKEIDIAATLEHIRDQRMAMVKTKAQFEYVLTAVAEEVQAILKALAQNWDTLRTETLKQWLNKYPKNNTLFLQKTIFCLKYFIILLNQLNVSRNKRLYFYNVRLGLSFLYLSLHYNYHSNWDIYELLKI